MGSLKQVSKGQHLHFIKVVIEFTEHSLLFLRKDDDTEHKANRVGSILRISRPHISLMADSVPLVGRQRVPPYKYGNRSPDN